MYLIVMLIALTSMLSASFNDGFHLSTMMGCSYSGSSPLIVKFKDRESLNMSAKYNNRCFTDSHWWSARLENWTNKTAWGVELIHHKIYLANTNSVIEDLSVSDGYNLLFFNLAKQVNNTNYRVGFGVVYAHMDVTIAGRERFIRKGFKGHYLTGPAFQLSIEQILWQSSRHFVSFDSKFTAAYAEIPISSDNTEMAIMPDYALHFSLAVGSKPQQLKSKNLYDKLSYFVPLAYPAFVGNYVLGTGALPKNY
jgi:hypothetical protein